MIDLDKTLHKQIPVPERALRSDFTQGVLTGIQNRKHIRWTTKLLRKLHTKLGLGILGAALLLGGTAGAAITLWPPAPTVTPTVTKQLPSGNHIIGYDTQNCDYYDELKDDSTAPTNDKVYYEVAKGSQLTDEQLESSLQGVCEENISNNEVSAVENMLPRDKQGDSSSAFTVTAISTNSITVSPDSHYDGSIVTKPNQTYTRFDSGFLVYDQNTKSDFSAIHVGDDIKMITKDTSELLPSKTYIPSDHLENQLVEALVKIPPLTANPSLFYASVARDLVRVDPCATDPSGFCRAYDFTN